MKRFTLFILGLFSYTAMANHYTVPPTSQTYGYVPVISDTQMKQCVEQYNQTKWLGEELNRIQVNRYSNYEVNLYNQKLSQYNQVINWFNSNCAGKQSLSACKAAQELNLKNGIPSQNCY